MTLGRGRVTCVLTSRVTNYYKKTSRRVQCGGGRGATTECMPCKPEDLELKDDYLNSDKITNHKSIQIHKRLRKISIKNSYIRALTTFNKLPKELKELTSNNIRKIRIKNWIKDNC
ncbi:hypothetical protein TSAR_007795 [Trichomalopsis sarcophagae]|uniref:Uncharacterized protein n=1 Tax=Trichomalopsis sarcophagae TaxID=543379 RepID=A0A232FKF5_9HYME|nr:hypothetical protein TSAR_007795 [Trichomalopsis sarcophagae]